MLANFSPLPTSAALSLPDPPLQALTRPVLELLLRADAHIPKSLALALHSLYLTLMADQRFKMDIAKSYTAVYRQITRDFASGVGMADSSLYTLSVQFLNRATFVTDLVEKVSVSPNQDLNGNTR